ncbi:MAG: glycosyltransferase [Desulfobacteraceae bacterium]|nr:glycosyltransferase [Desulfobacteraceae bacterium]
MTTSIESAHARFMQLTEALKTDALPPPEVLQQYCDLAAAAERLDTARQTLFFLKEKHPKDIGIHSRYITLCIQMGDGAEAMATIESMAGRMKLTDEFIDAALSVRKRLGPTPLPKDKSDSLSLCMIARNESKFMGACLLGVKPLIDEIILVDTGSNDRTADIGRLFGAQVFHFQWCDDFSAARNFGLSKATGQWILILDADEAIAPSEFAALRALIRNHEKKSAAFAIETRNYCYTANTLGWMANSGRYPAHEAGLGWFPSTKVRLFRRQDQIQFHFPVHERVEPSLRAAGIAVKPCKVPVHHYGHLNESRNQAKARKYFELGIAKLEAMADDPGAVRELAVQAGQLEKWPEALSLWQQLLRLRPGYPEALINLAGACWQLGQYTQSLEWALRAVAADKGMKEAHFNEALSHMMLAEFPTAQRILEELLKGNKDYVAAQFMLGVVYCASGKMDKGRGVFNHLKTTNARTALPQALEDIGQRLMKAGLAQAAENLKAICLA